MKNPSNSGNKRKNQLPFKIMASTPLDFESVRIYLYGYLWTALTTLGIDIFPTHKQKASSRVIYIMKKCFFPGLFFLNFLQCFIRTWLSSQLDSYVIIMDITLHINPVCLWISVFYHRLAIQEFITRLAITTKIAVGFGKNIKRAININLLIQFVYVLLQACLLWYNFGDENEYSALTIFKNFSLLFHDNSLSIVITTAYCSICCIFVHLLKNCEKTAKQLVAQPSSAILTHLLTEYYDILKNIENFQNTFSTCTFFCMMQSILSLSFDMMHWVSGKKIGASAMLQAVIFLFHSCWLVLSLTICAGEIPLEMRRVKGIFVNANPEYLKCMKDIHFKTLVDLIQRKKVPVLSSCNIMVFDRAFILKIFGILSAQTVIFYQLITGN
ncbi:hypothetical protein AVEN_162149-1 [Araneus ventricosus]|uniref:Uncharacterized protein n=1 Tax=Araneus ventricosus TaxID=182803 RepID=A0A4Y2HQ96_ARAVE|nr:hypothetical protein AVEN_162149-1 [Araneus ventricosus]